MAIEIITGFRPYSRQALDGRSGPYETIAAAKLALGEFDRYVGLQVLVLSGTVVKDGDDYIGGLVNHFIFDGGIQDSDLIPFSIDLNDSSTLGSSILPVVNGGTGLATVPSNNIITGNGTAAMTAHPGLTFDGTDLTVAGDVFVGDNISITGNLTVNGSTYLVNPESIDVSTAYVGLNTGYTGAPPATLQSGVIVARGTADPYVFLYDEHTQQFRIGEAPWTGSHYDDASTQAVATRENSPAGTALAYWDAATEKFKTSTNLSFSASNILNVSGTVSATTITGANVTSGVDPGHTHTGSNYSLPLATDTIRGGIELFNDTDQSVTANAVSSTSSRTYGIQLNSANQAVVNVPWVDTDTNTWRAAYILPQATTTVRGGIEIYSNTDQSVAANAVSSTASRTYGIQLNSANQAVVNVPWTNNYISHTHSNEEILPSELDMNANGVGDSIIRQEYVGSNVWALKFGANQSTLSAGKSGFYLNSSDAGEVRLAGATDTSPEALISATATSYVPNGFTVSAGNLTVSSGDVNISGSYKINGTAIATTDTNTWRAIHSIPQATYTTTSISSHWAYSAGRNFTNGGNNIAGNFTATGDITAFSDRRLKDNINPIENALDKIKQLEGVTFTRNDLEDTERIHIGLIAQDVEKILPELVKTETDELETKSVNYQNMVVVLIEAVKDQQKQIDELKTIINSGL